MVRFWFWKLKKKKNLQMNVLDSQREAICTVQNQKTTPWKRPKALSSRHTVDSLCFCNNTFYSCLLAGSCLVPFCWFHCGATVPTDQPPNEHLRLFLKANMNRPLVLCIHTRQFAKQKTTLHKTIRHHWLTAPILFANHFLMTKVLW